MGVLQKITQTFNTREDRIEAYLVLVIGLSGMTLTPLERKLVAHMHINGDISNVKSKADFIKNNNSTHASLGNVISRLKGVGVIVKENGRNVLHPDLRKISNSEDLIELDVKLTISKND